MILEHLTLKYYIKWLILIKYNKLKCQYKSLRTFIERKIENLFRFQISNSYFDDLSLKVLPGCLVEIIPHNDRSETALPILPECKLQMLSYEWE